MNKNLQNLSGASGKETNGVNSGESEGKCARFMQVLQLILDDEASKEDREFFKARIDNYSVCLEAYEIEKTLLVEIKSKLEKKCCPEQVVLAIKDKLKNHS